MLRIRIKIFHDWFILDMSKELFEEFKRWVTYNPCLKPDEAGYEKPWFSFVNNDDTEIILFRDKIHMIEVTEKI